jgi:hypothetical protein
MNKIQVLANDILSTVKKTNLKSDIIDFFIQNTNPNDAKLHSWAEKMGHDTHQVETEIYKFATLFIKFLTGGRANSKKFTEKDANKKELAMGIKVESEHITDTETQKRIALDHLSENSAYYSALAKMEKELGIKD